MESSELGLSEGVIRELDLYMHKSCVNIVVGYCVYHMHDQGVVHYLVRQNMWDVLCCRDEMSMDEMKMIVKCGMDCGKYYFIVRMMDRYIYFRNALLFCIVEHERCVEGNDVLMDLLVKSIMNYRVWCIDGELLIDIVKNIVEKNLVKLRFFLSCVRERDVDYMVKYVVVHGRGDFVEWLFENRKCLLWNVNNVCRYLKYAYLRECERKCIVGLIVEKVNMYCVECEWYGGGWKGVVKIYECCLRGDWSSFGNALDCVDDLILGNTIFGNTIFGMGIGGVIDAGCGSGNGNEEVFRLCVHHLNCWGRILMKCFVDRVFRGDGCLREVLFDELVNESRMWNMMCWCSCLVGLVADGLIDMVERLVKVVDLYFVFFVNCKRLCCRGDTCFVEMIVKLMKCDRIDILEVIFRRVSYISLSGYVGLVMKHVASLGRVDDLERMMKIVRDKNLYVEFGNLKECCGNNEEVKEWIRRC